ncbi:MAG TPA: hypothetical protein VN258_08585 [Mobilitalea sp.]|nr:hypothetical protein [Mobilitalea sp.]
MKYTQNRIHLLEQLFTRAQDRLELCKPKIPFNMKMMLTCNLYRLETELRVTRELLEEIRNAKDWDTSFVQFLE